MLGLCHDEFTKEIYRRGYSLVTLPQSNIKPLLLLGRSGKRLTRYGDLANVFEAANFALPEINLDPTVAPIDVKQTSALDHGLGLAILAKWLGNNAPELSAQLKKSARFSLQLEGITCEFIDLNPLDKYLAASTFNSNLPMLDELLDSDNLYMVNAVLKSKALTLESSGETLVEGKVDIPDVGYGVSGNAKVRGASNESRKVTFDASEPVVFAFQAVQIIFRNGQFASLHPNRKTLVMGTDSEPTEPKHTGYLSDLTGPRFAHFEE